jgi:hypothetical protein
MTGIPEMRKAERGEMCEKIERAAHNHWRMRDRCHTR